MQTKKKKSWEIMAAELSQEILSGKYSPETSLPGEYPLCERFNVSRTTVRRTMIELEKRGLVYRRHGKGTFIHPVQSINLPPVGLLILKPEKLTGDYFTEIIRGCNSYLNSLGSHISVLSTKPAKWNKKLLSSLAGVIIIPIDIENSDLEILDKNKLPYVTIMESGISSPTIKMDPETRAYELTSLLLENGHRKIGLLSGNFAHSDNLKRRGIEKALKEYKLDIDNIPDIQTDYNSELAKTSAEKLLYDNKTITAVIAFDDALGMQMINTAKTNGLSLPEELSIVGFNDFPFSSLIEPALTTVHFPTFEAGKTATSLIASNYFKDIKLQSIMLNSKIIVRDSVSNVKTRKQH